MRALVRARHSLTTMGVRLSVVCCALALGVACAAAAAAAAAAATPAVYMPIDGTQVTPTGLTASLDVVYHTRIPRIGTPGRAFTLELRSTRAEHCIASDLRLLSQTWVVARAADVFIMPYARVVLPNITSPDTHADCAAYMEARTAAATARVAAIGIEGSPIDISVAERVMEGALAMAAPSALWEVWHNASWHLGGPVPRGAGTGATPTMVRRGDAPSAIVNVRELWGGWIRLGVWDAYLRLPRGDRTRAEYTTQALAVWWREPACVNMQCTHVSSDALCGTRVRLAVHALPLEVTTALPARLRAPNASWVLHVVPELERVRLPPSLCAGLDGRGLPDPLPLAPTAGPVVHVAGWSDALQYAALVYPRRACDAPEGHIYVGLRFLGNSLFYSAADDDARWLQACTLPSPRPWETGDTTLALVAVIFIVLWYLHRDTLFESRTYRASEKRYDVTVTHAHDVGPIGIEMLLAEVAGTVTAAAYITWAALTLTFEARLNILLLISIDAPWLSPTGVLVLVALLLGAEGVYLFRAFRVRAAYGRLRVLARAYGGHPPVDESPFTVAARAVLGAATDKTVHVTRRTLRHEARMGSAVERTPLVPSGAGSRLRPVTPHRFMQTAYERWATAMITTGDPPPDIPSQPRLTPLLFMRHFTYETLLLLMLYIALLEGGPQRIRQIVILPIGLYTIYMRTVDMFYLHWTLTTGACGVADFGVLLLAYAGVVHFALMYCMAPLVAWQFDAMGTHMTTLATWAIGLLGVSAAAAAAMRDLRARVATFHK